MADRTLPEPDRYAVCPFDGPILHFYKGVFDAAYVLLHPFIRPVSISADRFNEQQYLSANDLCRSCEAVSWTAIQATADLPSVSAVDIALKTLIGGLKSELASKEFADKLEAALRKSNVVEPSEGSFAELTQNAMLSFIQSLGYQWVWVGDEHCTERKLYWIDDLKPPNAKHELFRSNVFTPDKAVLWTVHWDSHYSFFCSSIENVAKLSRCTDLEGFVCDETTEVYWSVRNG